MAHVLLVQDDEDTVVIFRRALSKAGVSMTLSVAQDADSALRALRESPRPFDLVLLDLHLPGGRSGLEVLASVPEGRPPMVVLTGTASPSEVQEARRLGARAVHEVPGDLASLTALLRDVCRAYAAGS